MTVKLNLPLVVETDAPLPDCAIAASLSQSSYPCSILLQNTFVVGTTTFSERKSNLYHCGGPKETVTLINWLTL